MILRILVNIRAGEYRQGPQGYDKEICGDHTQAEYNTRHHVSRASLWSLHDLNSLLMASPQEATVDSANPLSQGNTRRTIQSTTEQHGSSQARTRHLVGTTSSKGNIGQRPINAASNSREHAVHHSSSNSTNASGPSLGMGDQPRTGPEPANHQDPSSNIFQHTEWDKIPAFIQRAVRASLLVSTPIYRELHF
jgi:hypothetical protein